jgi:hypothetical protein
MTDVQTEANAKKVPAKKAAAKAPAKKAPAKEAAKAPKKEAAKKAPAKAVKAAKKEAKPKKDEKPYTGSHPAIWDAIGQKTTSKIGQLLSLLIKNEGNQIKMSKVVAQVYGGDEEAAGGVNMRINQLQADIAASKVANKVEIKKERKTADKEGTIGIYIK